MICNKKIFFCITLFVSFFLLIYLPVFAYPNLYSIHINSVEPKIDCILIRDFDSIINECDENIYKYDDYGILDYEHPIEPASTRLHAQQGIGNYTENIFNNPKACVINPKITLPNGIDWCDKEQVYKFFKKNDDNYLILGFFQEKYRINDKDFIFNYELRYHEPPEVLINTIILRVILIIVAIILTWIVLYYSKIKKA